MPLGEVAEVQLGKMLSEKARRGRSARPYLRNVNVRWHAIDTSDVVEMDFEPREVEKYQLDRGDVLVCEGGEPGRAAVWYEQMPNALYQKALHRVRFYNGVVDPKLFVYQLELAAQEGSLAQAFTGSTIRHLPREAFIAWEIVVPPVAEQRRIVAALEEHLSDLDAAMASLKRVRGRLEQYRQAVYDAACSPAAAKFRSGNAALPADWVISTPEELASDEDHALAIGPFGSNLKVSDYRDAGVPLVFVRNIRAAYFGPEGARYVSADKAKELRPHHVRGGDILVTKMGDPPGDACLYPVGAAPAVITADCIKWTVDGAKADTRYLVYALRSFAGRRGILDATRGVAQLKVSLGRFRTLKLPLPPLEQQREIANEIDRRLVLANRTAAEVDIQLARGARLRQSILKRAFEGKLVPQDVADEPMSGLLARLSDTPKPIAASRARVSRRRATAHRERN